MYELKVVGEVEVRGKKIKHVEGGFGENQRAITAKDVALEHDMKLIHVNELINRNIKRFKEGIDYVDLKVVVLNDNNFSIEDLGYSKMQISKAEHIYILSERGYSKIIKIMDSDLAWEIYDDLLDGYFSMREAIKEISKETMLLVSIAQAKDKVSQMVAIAEYGDYCKQLAEENMRETVVKPLEHEVNHKQNVINGLTENISLADKRQRISQIVKHGSKKYQERYNLLYDEFDKVNHSNVRLRLKNGKERGEIKKSVNIMEYICSEKYLNKTDALYELTCKIFEGDFLDLLEEWKQIAQKEK